MRRIGIFGGTFDPPHVGHLVIAEWARVALGLDRVVFMPAGTPPHKVRKITPAVHRVAMTRLAVRGHRAFKVSPHETRRDGPSYTVDTLRAFRRAHPGARLYLIIGRDSLDDFDTWRDPQGILSLATLAVAERVPARGVELRAPGAALHRRVVAIGNPIVEVSSRALRERMRRGRSVRYLVPDAVAAYAARHRLYRRAR